MAKPKTTRVPKIKAPKGDNRFDSLNEGLAKLNKTLAGGITNVKNNDGSTIKGKVYFTPGGATDKTGKVRYTASGGTKTFGETGNTTGVTANPKNTESSEPTVISSVDGESQLKQYQSDAAKLDIGLSEEDKIGMSAEDIAGVNSIMAGSPGISVGEAKGVWAKGGEKIPPPSEPQGQIPTTTYIDPNTGATETTTGAGSGSEEERKKMQERGLQVSESTTQSEITDPPEIKKLKDELALYEKEIAGYKNKLLDLIITDADLKSDIRGITKAYDARIAEMRDVTDRQIQGIKTLGYRMGAQYTGGMGGVWGGIISDAERQGILKVASIEGEKQSKILEAKAAARENNYKIYASLMEDARELQKQKVTALADLVKEQKAQDAEIAKRKKQIENDTLVSDLYHQGFTTADEIVNQLNVNPDGTISDRVTLEEVEKALKILNPPDALKGLDADYQTFNYLKKINDPSVAGLDWIDYQRIMANLKATASGANKLTAEERVNKIASSYASAFVPGATTTVIDKKTGNPVEINVLGPDNYLNPSVFNEAIVDAEINGMPRTTFIERFGYLVNPAQTGLSETVTDENGNTYQLPYEQYVLSPEEYRMATGLEPENIDVLTRTGNANLERTTKIGTAKTE